MQHIWLSRLAGWRFNKAYTHEITPMVDSSSDLVKTITRTAETLSRGVSTLLRSVADRIGSGNASFQISWISMACN
jgi:hypothetical protein